MNLESAIKKVIRDVPDFPRDGIIFKDITPVFYDQHLCNEIVDGFINRLSEKPDAVIGIDLDYEVLGQGGSMLMVSASGTAVKLG